MSQSDALTTALVPPALRAALIVLGAGTVLAVIGYLPHRPPTPDHFVHIKELLVHATALAGVLLCLRDSPLVERATEDRLLVVFAFLGGLSLFTAAVNPWLGWRAFGVTLSTLAAFWCARALARAGLSGPVTGIVSVALALLAGSALLEAYAGVELSTAGRAPGGTLGHRNTTAHLLVLSLPVLALQMARVRTRWGAGLVCLAAAAAAAVVILSRSRGAWLTALVLVSVALGALFLLRGGFQPLSRRRAAALGLALVAGGACAVLLPNRLGWHSASPHLDTLRRLADHGSGSGRGRLIQYATTARMVADHPLLGVGPGNWTITYPRYAIAGDPSYRPRELLPTQRLPQGDWIGLASERGLPALAALVLAAAVMAARCLRRLRGSRDAEERERVFAALLVLAGVALLGTLDPLLLQPVPALLTALVLGALVPSDAAAGGPRPRAPLRRALAAMALLLFLQPLVISLRGVAATSLISRSEDLRTLARAVRANPGDFRLQAIVAHQWILRRRCDRAIPHADAALRLFPAAPAARDLLARCGVEEDIAAASPGSAAREVR